VQGGGCLTVGVAGLVLGGGFGSHSKAFGTAGSSLLEAELVTADGAVRVVNAYQDADLFWALKGGGAGAFGVVTKLTLKTWDLPASFGVVATVIEATSGDAYRRLLHKFMAFYAERLANPHWGEIAKMLPGERLQIDMNFQGLTKDEAFDLWSPFFNWVASDAELTARPPTILAGRGRSRWDPAALDRIAPGAVLYDDRPGAPHTNFFWRGNLAEAGHVIHGFNSLWLPANLLEAANQASLVEALVAASREWAIEIHFQKGLAGAPAQVIAAVEDTPMNPRATKAFALAIIASEGPPAYPGLPNHAPDLAAARRAAAQIEKATAALRVVSPHPGAYVAESSYFQEDWQAAYWGDNYARLLRIKERVDPDGLFFSRHGVGSEMWSEDGFTRLA